MAIRLKHAMEAKDHGHSIACATTNVPGPSERTQAAHVRDPWPRELIAQVRAMAKIKAANRLQQMEKEQLEALVSERTSALMHEHAASRPG